MRIGLSTSGFSRLLINIQFDWFSPATVCVKDDIYVCVSIYNNSALLIV